MSELNNAQFEYLSRSIFQRALTDINTHSPQAGSLKDPDHVSFESFRRYVTVNHHLIARMPTVEMLTMALYKKAIDDIAFQANIFGFLLREIPIIQQRNSCDAALADLQQMADQLASAQG